MFESLCLVLKDIGTFSMWPGKRSWTFWFWMSCLGVCILGCGIAAGTSLLSAIYSHAQIDGTQVASGPITTLPQTTSVHSPQLIRGMYDDYIVSDIVATFDGSLNPLQDLTDYLLCREEFPTKGLSSEYRYTELGTGTYKFLLDLPGRVVSIEITNDETTLQEIKRGEKIPIEKRR